MLLLLPNGKQARLHVQNFLVRGPGLQIPGSGRTKAEYARLVPLIHQSPLSESDVHPLPTLPHPVRLSLRLPTNVNPRRIASGDGVGLMCTTIGEKMMEFLPELLGIVLVIRNDFPVHALS